MRGAASSTITQAQLDEHDDGAKVHLPQRPQYSTYNEQAINEVHTDRAALAHSLSGATGDAYSATGRASDACFTSFGFPASQATSGTTSTFHELEANVIWGQSNSDPQESDDTGEGVFPSFSTSLIANGLSPSLTHDPLVAAYLPLNNGTDPAATALKCPHPSCSSKAVFMRLCDLHKHYYSHFRKYSCRVPNCHLAEGKLRIFALRKDRDRHERAHKPSIPCLYCDRLFSRQDNWRDHCQKRHGELL